MNTYTLYIDESGETGLKKIRAPTAVGASPYMTLGGVLIPDPIKEEVISHLDEITKTIGRKNLHCSNLNHRQKVYFSREMSKISIVFFGVISLKSTLGNYKNDINSDGTKYFNKCAQYMLERVGSFLTEQKISSNQLKIIFEEGYHEYAQFRSFIKACQISPIHPNTKYLRNLDIAKIFDASKVDEPLLQIADLVAHSLFKAVDKTERNYFIPEPRYLSEIHKNFYHDPKTKEILNFGLRPIHKLSQINLDEDVYALINSFSAK